MTQADFKAFSGLMQGVAECYGQSLSAQGVVLRFMMLEAFAFVEVQKAALSLMSTRKFTTMPTPADFLEHLNGGSAEDKAEVEVGKVLTAIERHGGYASVVFDDAVTQAVIVQAYGGWAKLCGDCGVEDSESWFRKGFVKTWAAYCRQGIEHTGHLPGRSETTNRSSAFTDNIPAPVLIGDPAKARAVLQALKSSLELASSPEAVRGTVCALADALRMTPEQ